MKKFYPGHFFPMSRCKYHFQLIAYMLPMSDRGFGVSHAVKATQSHSPS